MGESRVHKSLLNARVNIIFYFLSLFFSFFSRKIFLDCLGAEFIGLTGTLSNILGYLNLAELGVGAAISFFLFKPIQQGDRQQICEVISLYGFLYRKIGLFILCAGVIISLFFPLIFAKENLGFGIIYFSYYSILGSALIGYFINYRQILLSADQKNYLVAIYFQSSNLVKIALQMFLAIHFSNLYLWVSIEFLFGIIGCIILNWKINKEYPWLKSEVSKGKQLIKKYPTILSSTRQVFIHKIKDFLLNRSDQIMVYAFVSLKMVAYYGNYTLIVTKVLYLFNSALDSVGAGVGNLVAEGNIKNTMKVFWELMVIRHFVAGLVVFSLYMLLEPFITIWLGPQYILSREILVLLLAYQYIAQSRGVVDMFNHAHGLYADTWSAWAELFLNLSVTIVCGIRYGIVGILLGKLVSTLLIIVFWKPYYLFSAGLKRPVREYWIGTIRYYIVFAVSFAIAYKICSFYRFSPDNFLNLFLYGLSTVGTYLIINLLLLYFFCQGSHSCLDRLKGYRLFNRK